MKRTLVIIVTAAMLAGTVTALDAQNYKIARKGDVALPDGTRAFANPSTTITVDVTVRKETVTKGPYARFAQRYFGTMAPLADKEIHEIVSARIGYFDTETPESPLAVTTGAASPVYLSHIDSPDEFTKVPIDKTSTANMTPEEGARRAADMIFALRKRRVELITGEYAETVYGEGLKAALDRMDYIENEYLALFFGKQTVTTYTKRYYVVPEKSQDNYIVCRFTADRGLLPDSDLSGEPLLLELKPEGRAGRLSAGDSKPRKGETAAFVIADNVVCRLMESKRELDRRAIPVFQFGADATLPER